MPEGEYVRRSFSLGPPRRRRTFEQRLRARMPGLIQALSSRVLSLPPRSRLRQALVERATRAGYDAYNRRDWEVVLAAYGPQVQIRLHHVQDMEGVYHGHEGLRRYWQLWFDAWDESHMEPTEIIEFPERILYLGRTWCRNRRGLTLEEPTAWLMTLRKGRIVEHEEWWDHEAALKAVGLAP